MWLPFPWVSHCPEFVDGSALIFSSGAHGNAIVFPPLVFFTDQLLERQMMKIAITGKGGVGKTTIAGTLARLLGRQGMPVLAIDGDSNPNLAVTLGLSREDAESLRAVPSSLLERKKGCSAQDTTLVLNQSLDEIVASYGAKAADDVTLMMIGQPDHAGSG